MDEETGQPGDGFSVDVCKKWEAVCNQFHLAETRRLILRLGIVLSHDSEAIKVLHQLARFGLGGKQGRGNQYFCWIHAIDFCKAIDRMIDDDQMNGVYNLCSPFPVTNCELMALIRKRFGIPFGVPLSEPLLRLGAMVMGTETELILKSRRVVPMRLLKEGYKFTYPTLDKALEIF